MAAIPQTQYLHTIPTNIMHTLKYLIQYMLVFVYILVIPTCIRFNKKKYKITTLPQMRGIHKAYIRNILQLLNNICI